MSVLETAIRNALARSDRANAETRAKVYHSARAALDNGLLKQGVIDKDVISQQRERLETLINSIEAEEQEAVLAAQEAAQRQRQSPERPAQSDADVVADVLVARRDDDAWRAKEDPALMDAIPLRRETKINFTVAVPEKQDKKDKKSKTRQMEGSGEGDVRPEARPRRSRARSSMFTRIFIIGLLLIFGVGTAFWVKQSGLWTMIQQHGFDLASADLPEDTDTTPLVKNPLDPRRSFDSSWLDIFKGADAASLETKGDAAVEPAKAADGAYALITSASAGKSGEVSVPVSPEVLAQMTGKTSTIALTIGSGDDTSSQVSAECSFANNSDCGRHRFNVTAERSDFLFKLTMPKGGKTLAPGKIILNSDINGGGKSVKLFAIRVLPGE